MRAAPALDDIEARCIAALADVAADAAHDRQHIRRVVLWARRLAEEEGARPDVVVPAAWLHDCVHVPKSSPDRARASRMAAAQATAWLTSWGVAADVIEAIAHAIEAHSFSAGIPPRTLEARVVQDADRLDAIGAIGLARCLMLGGAMGRPLYDADDPFCERRPADDAVSAVDHFYTKLLTLADTMQTVSARREAGARTVFLRSFLDELRRELP